VGKYDRLIKKSMQLPKLGGALGQVTSPEAIAVFTAAILTPIVYPYISKAVANIPFLSDHLTTAMILFAVLALMIASRLKDKARAIAIGLAGAFVLIGLAPFIQKYLPNAVIP